MIKGVSVVGIPVSDQDRAVKFYTEVLGFSIFTDQEMGEGQRWIELKIPGSPTNLALFTPDGHKDRVGTFSNVSFLCDDAKKTYAALLERGVEFTAPPKVEPWGTMVIFKDPDGNSFCLTSK